MCLILYNLSDCRNVRQAECPLFEVPDAFEYKSIVKQSNVLSTTVILSEIQSSEATGSKVLYSIVDHSFIGKSILNATYDDRRLNELDAEEIFCSRDKYCFNKIHDSFVVSSVVGNHHECPLQPKNSTIISSNIQLSGIQNSIIVVTKVCESVSCSSIITESDLRRGTKVLNSGLTQTNATATGIFNSRTQIVIAEHSCITESDACTTVFRNSSVFSSTFENSTICQSTISSSRILESDVYTSNLTESTIMNCTKIQNSDIRNSLIEDRSEVLGSKIYNSTVINATLVNCFIVNALIKNERQTCL